MSAYAKLRGRRRLFVDAYVELGIGTEAASRAGYQGRNLDSIASRILATPGVREAVEERKAQAAARAGVRQVRVLEELAAIAFLDPAELFDENGQLLPLRSMPPAARRALTGLDVEELFEGTGRDRQQIGLIRKPRVASKLEALKLLGQHLALFVERHEVTGAGGGPIETKELTDIERARRVAFLLARALHAAPASAPNPAREAGDSPPAISTQQEIEP